MSGAAASQEHPAAPLDGPTKWTTAAFCVALVGVVLTVPSASPSTAFAVVFGYVVPLGVIAASYGFAPRGYELRGDGVLRVHRRWFGTKSFRVTSAQAVAALFGLGGFRLAGSGGAFGWYGLFWRKDTGRYRAYVTNRSHLVACHGPDGLVVISPDSPASFLAALPAAPAGAP